jgi:hypothetical protein
MSPQSISAASTASLGTTKVSPATQESSETAAQTAKEASQGDRQAQALEAKRAASALTPPPQSAASVINTSGQVTGTTVNTKA